MKTLTATADKYANIYTEATHGKLRNVLFVIEEGEMHVGFDKKGNFITEVGERVEITMQARNNNHAMLIAKDMVKPNGRTTRTYVDGVESFCDQSAF